MQDTQTMTIERAGANGASLPAPARAARGAAPGAAWDSTRAARSGGRGTDEQRRAAERRRVFGFDLAVLALLMLVAWAYVQPPGIPLGEAAASATATAAATAARIPAPSDWEWWHIRRFMPESIRLALYAMWFGAIGGIMISLKAVYDHGPRDWQEKYNLWHYGRPASGALAGGITYLLLLAVSGSSPIEPAILAAAFIMGTQERRFFNFLYEAARLIVQVPGDTQDQPLMVEAIRPAEAKEGDELSILGGGFDPAVRVQLGETYLQNVVVSRDGATISGLVPRGPLRGGPVDVMVINQSGAARRLVNGFRFVPVGTDVAGAWVSGNGTTGNGTAGPGTVLPAPTGLPEAPGAAAAGATTTEAAASGAAVVTPAGGVASGVAGAVATRAADGLPAVRTEPLLLEFRPQPVGGEAEGRTIELINGGAMALVIRRASIIGDTDSFTLAGGLPEDLTLSPGEVWKLGVRFTARTTGAAKALLLFETAELSAPAASVPLTGTGIPGGA
jgi:hypothetical protein